jgi:decaprenylphospho-beta-D-erythro-pentofuranosid-2-ulose 2-reductase
VNDAFGRPQSALVLGGTSEIALAILAKLVPGGCRDVVLAGRDDERLAAAAQTVGDAGAEHVATVTVDAADLAGVAGAVEACLGAFAGRDIDLVLMAVGVLGDQDADERSPAAVVDRVGVGFTWPAAVLAGVADHLRRQGHGRIVVLSSVAGVRVRRANYVYGSAKAGLDGYAVGLAEALRGTGVSVQVVRPGFVRTKMTEGRPAAPFSVGPDDVADAVVAGLGTSRTVIWVPSVLKWAFTVFVNLPQALWRRLPG